MSFFETLGSFMGSLTAKAEEMQKRIEMYRDDYEDCNNSELIAELRRLKGSSRSSSDRDRILCIDQILKERGIKN